MLTIPAWIKILTVLHSNEKKYYLQNLSRECNVSLRHIKSTISRLEKMGLIYTSKKKRKKYVYFTEKGELIGKLASLLHFNLK